MITDSVCYSHTRIEHALVKSKLPFSTFSLSSASRNHYPASRLMFLSFHIGDRIRGTSLFVSSSLDFIIFSGSIHFTVGEQISLFVAV